ncbi:MEDS domain-containing protein [Sutcliffiella horikoshii]|uniref:MEDS domain-containing protein n=1 Tax=Sutcliffiella horikoshii TaxID=79883 RepID=UPI00384CB871
MLSVTIRGNDVMFILVEIKSILEVRPISISSTQSLENITAGHVYYLFEDRDVYLEHLITFVKTGLKTGENVLIIESMKNISKINAELDKHFNEEQKSNIRVVNNFDYYFASGDFNTKAMLAHFAKDVILFNRENNSIRTWANVEWASDDPDAEELKFYEATIDEFVLDERMVSVCAYSRTSITPTLDTILKQLHYYQMTDESFTVSDLYKKP